MTETNHNLDALLALVADGRLDELTPEQVAALEEHLNARPEAVGRLENVVPEPDSLAGHAGPAPSEAEWEAVWDGIDAGCAVAGGSEPRRIGRVITFWQPLVAVAACLLLIVFWRAMPSRNRWPIELSDHVVVHDLEVFGDESAFIAYSDDNTGSAIIWVFDETEESKGA
jgi:hypothetical protein